jgi:hypothetical protein
MEGTELLVTRFPSGRLFIVVILSALFPALCPSTAVAQGSIFGEVTNADAGIPAEGDISFFGYLDDTDEEIRIESSIGAGFDAGNWFDDFQNYLTEGPGNPYDYHFYNHVNNQGYVLSGLIPDNSFQQENVTLAPVGWPSAPENFTGEAPTPFQVVLHWADMADISYHLYRRDASSDGSFFRIDDPSGSLAGPGLSDSFYVDNSVDSLGAYDYLIIPQDLSGDLGPHSAIVTVDIFNTFFIVGDSNRDGLVNVGDAAYTLNYIFREGPPPSPYEAGDANCDILVNVGDVVFTINYIFREGPPPSCP